MRKLLLSAAGAAMLVTSAGVAQAAGEQNEVNPVSTTDVRAHERNLRPLAEDQRLLNKAERQLERERRAKRERREERREQRLAAIAAEQAAAEAAAVEAAAAEQAAVAETETYATSTSPELSSIAQCESGGDYSASTGNGYYGAYQFTQETWESVGGSGLPSEASSEEQDMRAQMLLEQSGTSPWPNCGG